MRLRHCRRRQYWRIPEHLLCARSATDRQFTFRYRSPQHWLEVFGTYYGPVFKALGALEGERREALENDLRALLDGFNEATDGTLVVPSGYLEVVVVRQA